MVDIDKDTIKCPVCDFDVAVDTNGKIIKHIAGTEECLGSGKTPAEAAAAEKIQEKADEKKAAAQEKLQEKKDEIISGIGGGTEPEAEEKDKKKSK
jgi:hypothetical protein